MEYDSALKRIEILTHSTISMKLEDMMLNKLDTEGQILHDSIYVRHLEKLDL